MIGNYSHLILFTGRRRTRACFTRDSSCSHLPKPERVLPQWAPSNLHGARVPRWVTARGRRRQGGGELHRKHLDYHWNRVLSYQLDMFVDNESWANSNHHFWALTMGQTLSKYLTYMIKYNYCSPSPDNFISQNKLRHQKIQYLSSLNS